MYDFARRSGATFTIAATVALVAASLAAPVAAQDGVVAGTEPEVTTDERPGKSRGKATHEVLQGPGNVCNGFKNDYTIVPGDEPGTGEMRRRFSAGVTDAQEMVFFDPSIGVVAFGDDSDQFDSFTIVGLAVGDSRPRGFLLEGPDGSIDQDDLVQQLARRPFEDIDTWNNETWRARIRPIGEEFVQTVSNGCFWGSVFKPDKKSRKSLDDLRRWLAPGVGVADTSDDAEILGLNDERFAVDIEWADGSTDGALVTPEGSDWTGHTFFAPDSDSEVLLGLLDRCDGFDHFWVFAATTTNIGYTLTVTDTQTNETKTYYNPLERPSRAVTDTSAFATCP